MSWPIGVLIAGSATIFAVQLAGLAAATREGFAALASLKKQQLALDNETLSARVAELQGHLGRLRAAVSRATLSAKRYDAATSTYSVDAAAWNELEAARMGVDEGLS